jgi:flagellar biogenesis protein FliO
MSDGVTAGRAIKQERARAAHLTAGPFIIRQLADENSCRSRDREHLELSRLSPLSCALASLISALTSPLHPLASAWWGWTQAGLTLALAALALWWVGRLSQGSHRPNSAMSITSRLSLSPRKTLYLVRVGRRGLVIGASDSGLTPMMELSEEEMTSLSQLNTPLSSPSPPSLLGLLLPRALSATPASAPPACAPPFTPSSTPAPHPDTSTSPDD